MEEPKAVESKRCHTNDCALIIYGQSPFCMYGWHSPKWSWENSLSYLENALEACGAGRPDEIVKWSPKIYVAKPDFVKINV
jgi:hypothetical protein